ncbi:PAS/PAC sensor signal transduction histidine kinase [Hymenobacter roseosalivarius DSM 11622]|uniref:histidine kinase n=1 Tax=Hymenobacter roseosalivarius DSM 11622 TaxID=645990 RepID=A0A1W1V4T1_9BACT|nr:ATP-binding protein [Hymenobacter roseosalivarius]SMB87984.1 PAS/PAC sensor signal transduction histidine kinase [Hymenobacter roseosalivarius DSM 11622]
MTLRVKFLLFVVIIHGVLIVLAAQLVRTNTVLFLVTEALLVVSIILTTQLYRGFVRPFQLIAAGTAAIRAKDFSLKFVPVGQREMDQLIDVYNHMIDELRRERVAQHEKSLLLERLIQASPAGILILDFDGKTEATNPAAERFLGLTSQHLIGQPPAALPGDWGAFLSQLKPNEPQIVQLSGMQTYRASRGHFLDRGFTRYFILLEELTEALIRQEKQAYEKLIRMMSHEINNSIGAINSILQSFHHYAPQLTSPDQSDFREALDVSIARNTHLANFIAGFANLVRLPAPTRRSCDVHALLRATHRLMQVPSERRQVAWHWDLAPEPLRADLDAQQLEQVLINITKNALESIGDNGKIIIRTRLHPPLLQVEDDGPGIAPEAQRRLFTPFFSTKRDGQGIGLTLIRDILLQHGLRFSLETVEGRRTVFSVWLGE